MRPLRALILYLAAVFLGAALIAPWLYQFAQFLAPHAEWVGSLAKQPFHRYVNRCLIGLALLGLWPLLRRLGANSWRSVGVTSPVGRGHECRFGSLLGLASLALVALIAIFAGARELAPSLTLPKLSSICLQAAASALGVAMLEELLFRGVLFGRLCTVMGHWGSLGVSSAIYAIVHFFERVTVRGPVDWSTGLTVLGQMLQGFTHLQSLLPGFLTLTLAGMILAQLYHRTQALYAPIALHAGWIFWLKLYGSITVSRQTETIWVFGSGKLIDGWTAFGVMGICAWWAFRWKPKR